MIKYPEVLAHFSEQGLKIVSFTFEKNVFKVLKQSIVKQDNDEVIVNVLCTDGLEVNLTLNLSTLKWSYS